jgi:hypothetical protein
MQAPPALSGRLWRGRPCPLVAPMACPGMEKNQRRVHHERREKLSFRVLFFPDRWNLPARWPVPVDRA